MKFPPRWSFEHFWSFVRRRSLQKSAVKSSSTALFLHFFGRLPRPNALGSLGGLRGPENLNPRSCRRRAKYFPQTLSAVYRLQDPACQTCKIAQQPGAGSWSTANSRREFARRRSLLTSARPCRPRPRSSPSERRRPPWTGPPSEWWERSPRQPWRRPGPGR